MPYKTSRDLPSGVKDNLPDHAQDIWREAFNSAYEQHKDDERAAKIAWGAVKESYEKKDEKWVKKAELTEAIKAFTDALAEVKRVQRS